MLVLDQDSLAQTERSEIPGVLAPALQASAEPGLHGQLSLLPAVHPDLGWGEVPRLDGEKVLDRPAKYQLSRRKLVLRVRSVPVLHDGSG